MTNEQHNTYIAYAFFANAGFYLLILLLMLVMFGSFLGTPGPPPGFFAAMMGFLTLIYGMFMVPSIVAGYGLLKKRSWARIASIIAGVVAGMNFPIGTGACAYALWFFFSDNWKEVYEPNAFETSEQQRKQIAYGVESQQAAYEAESKTDYELNYREPPDWR